MNKKNRSNKKVVNVAIIGMSENEKRLLHSIFSLSNSREQCYVGASISTGPAPEILIVDGDDVKGAKHLRELIDDAGDKRSVAVLIRRGDSPLFIALRMND